MIMSPDTQLCQDTQTVPAAPATIGRQIRAARKAKGMTQWQLARAIGCSQTTIGDIEADYFPAASRFVPAAVAALGLAAAESTGIGQ